MPSLDRPAYIDWEGEWWWSSRLRFTLSKALQMTYCELCWRVFLDGGATRKDIPYLAKFHMDTEENIRKILALDHFYENEDGTFGHHVVDKKLEEQRGRRVRASNGGKKSGEVRREKAKRTASSTASSTGIQTNAGSLASETVKSASEKRPGGTSASRTALAPGGRGAGAGAPAAVVTPPVPGARVPVVWMDPEKSAVLSEDGEYWIDINGAGRLAVDPAKRVIPNLPGLRGTKGANHG